MEVTGSIAITTAISNLVIESVMQAGTKLHSDAVVYEGTLAMT